MENRSELDTGGIGVTDIIDINNASVINDVNDIIINDHELDQLLENLDDDALLEEITTNKAAQIEKEDEVTAFRIDDNRRLIVDRITSMLYWCHMEYKSAEGTRDGAEPVEQNWADILTHDRCQRIAQKLEMGCFSRNYDECIVDGVPRFWSNIQFVERYSIICYSVMANLDPRSSVGSTYLARLLATGQVDGMDVAHMSSEDMAPHANAAERKEIETRMKQVLPQKISRRYYCPKCRGNETTFEEYAGRSADEALKLSLKCVACKHVWRK